MTTEKRNESIKPVCWIQSNHLDQLIYKAVGSDAMHARVSTLKLASDWKPLYTTLQPDARLILDTIDENEALKAELKLLRGKVDPVLYMAKNIHNNSYATSFKEAEAKLYLAQSGLKNDGIEATIIPLFTHPPAQNHNVDER